MIAEAESTTSCGRTGDGVLDALEELLGVLRRLPAQSEAMICEAERVTALRRGGGAWENILATESAARLTTMLAESAEALAGANSHLRRAQVAALYERGMAMHRIGKLLGITRQRVAVLLGTVRH